MVVQGWDWNGSAPVPQDAESREDTSPLTCSLLLCSPPGIPAVGVAVFLMLFFLPASSGVSAPSAEALGSAMG